MNSTAPSHQTDAPTLPEGNTGIAAKYPGDAGIERDGAVIFTDNFDDYETTADLRRKWNYKMWQDGTEMLTTDQSNAHRGKKALEFTLPQGTKHGHGVCVEFKPGYDELYVRYYTKFDRDCDFYNAAHDGALLAAVADDFPYNSPGVRADGRNKFMSSLDTWRMPEMDPVPPCPGEWVIYCYHPDQKLRWGDNFEPKQRFLIESGRWYCCELMLKANTAGRRDGRTAFWVDGKLIGDFPHLRFRDVDTLKINSLTLTLYIANNRIRENRMWYDDVVVATSYIGPIAGDAPR